MKPALAIAILISTLIAVTWLFYRWDLSGKDAPLVYTSLPRLPSVGKDVRILVEQGDQAGYRDANLLSKVIPDARIHTHSLFSLFDQEAKKTAGVNLWMGRGKPLDYPGQSNWVLVSRDRHPYLLPDHLLHFDLFLCKDQEILQKLQTLQVPPSRLVLFPSLVTEPIPPRRPRLPQHASYFGQANVQEKFLTGDKDTAGALLVDSEEALREAQGSGAVVLSVLPDRYPGCLTGSSPHDLWQRYTKLSAWERNQLIQEARKDFERRNNETLQTLYRLLST